VLKTVRESFHDHDAQLSKLVRGVVLSVLPKLFSLATSCRSTMLIGATHVVGDTVKVTQGLSHGSVNSTGRHRNSGPGPGSEQITSLTGSLNDEGAKTRVSI
jgi:hypothetical protein